MSWMEKRPAMSWFLTGLMAGIALLLLVAEQQREDREGGAQSYYSQF
jgi:hypothetical protein